MKKILAALLAVMMTFSLVTIPATAEGEAVFTVPTIEAAPGDTVSVTVTFDLGEHEAHTLNSYLQYDPALLTANSITPGSGVTVNGGIVLPDLESEPGKAKLGAMYPTTGFSGSGELMTVSFTVSENATGSIPLAMVIREMDYMPVGASTGTPIPFTTVDGAIALGGTDATEPPATEPPVTEPPATEPPVTEPPVTEPPVTEPPVTVDFNTAANIEGGTLEFDNTISAYPWEVVVERDGRAFVRSTNQGVGSSIGGFSTTVDAGAHGGELSFEFISMGEGPDDFDWDCLRVFVDDTKVASYGRDHDNWASLTLEIEPGTHEIKFEYKKDSSYDANGDYAAIDNVAFTANGDPSAANATFAVAPEYQEVEAGGTFDVAVYIDGSFEAHMLNFQLNYDSEIFEFVSAQNGSVLDAAIDLNSLVVLDGETIPGSIRLGVLVPSDPLTATGELFTATFKAKDSASLGVYDFTPVVATFSNAPVDGDNAPVETPIDSTVIGGQVEIVETVTEPPVTEPPVTEPPVTAPPVTGSAIFSVDPASVQTEAGQEVTVDVRIEGDYEAHALNFQLDYDSDAFEFVSAENGEILTAAANASGAIILDGATIPGSVRLGVLMPVDPMVGDGVLFTLTLKAKDTAAVGSYPVDIAAIDFINYPLGGVETPIDHQDIPGEIEVIETITEPPVTEPPVTEPPVTEPPVTEPPVTEPPVTEPPVTEPPVTEPPVTEPPVTEPPVTEPPVTEPPVTVPPIPTPVPGTAVFYVMPEVQNAMPGDTITFDAMVSGTFDAHILNYQLNYDTEVFELVSVQNGAVMAHITSLGGVSLLDYTTIPGSIRLGVMMPVNGFTENGVLFTVTARIKDTAAAGYHELTTLVTEFANYPIGGANTPIDHSDIPGYVYVGGNVTEPPVTEPPVTEPPVTEPPVTEPPVTEPPVTEPPVTEPPVTVPPIPTPVPGTAVFYVMPEVQNAMPGDTITFDAMVSGTFDAHVLNYQLNYDTEVFELVSVQNGAVMAHMTSLGGVALLDYTTIPGSIRLGAMMPIDGFTENGVLFTVTARIKDTAAVGYHDLTPLVTEFANYPISGPNTPIEHSDIPGYVYVGGIVTEPPVTEPPVTEPPVTPVPGEVMVYVDPEHTEINHTQTFSFDVKIMGEYEAHALNLQLNYDSEHFEFVSAVNGEVLSNLASNALVVLDGETIPGSVRLGVLMPDEAMTGEGALINVTLREKGTADENVPYPLTPVTFDIVNYPLNGAPTPIGHQDIPGDVTVLEGDVPMQATFYVDPEHTDVQAGDTFTVAVKIEGNYEAHGLNHQLNYDPSIFEFVSIENAEVLDHIDSLNGTVVLDGETIPGSVRLGVLMPEGGFTMNGAFYNLTLRAKTTAPAGLYDLEQLAIDFVNFPLGGDSVSIDRTVNSGEVQITAPTFDTPTFIVEANPDQLQPGDTFEVAVRIAGEYPEAHTLNHQLNYDADTFEFVSLVNGPVLEQVTANGGFSLVDGETIPGSIRMGAMMPTTGFTLQDVFYTATFRVKGAAAEGVYPFEQNVVEFANFPLGGVETPIDHEIINDEVEITASPIEGVIFRAVPTPTDLVPEQVFTVDVTVENPYEAHGLNFQLNYDADTFEIVSVTEGAVLAEAVALNGVVVLDHETIPGSVRLGVLMPDEALTAEGVMFTMTVRVKASAQVGDYDFVPNAVDFVNFPLGGESTPIPHEDIPGTVHILGSDSVIFRALPDPTIVEPGQTFTVDVTVENPYEAHGLTLNLDYMSTYFEFVSAVNGPVLNDALDKDAVIVLDGETIPGSVRLGVLMPDAPMNLEGVLYTATFRVKEGAPVGVYDFVPNAIEFVNFPLEGVSTPIEHVDILGQVEIIENITPTPVPPTPTPEPPTPTPVPPTPTPEPGEPTPTPVPGEPTPVPTTPPTPPTGTRNVLWIGVAVIAVGAVVAGTSIFLKKRKQD